jgi:hypothetical protein
MSSTLIMHVDKNRQSATVDQLRGMAVLPATDSHKPIGHAVVRDLVADRLAPLGLTVSNEQIGVSTTTMEIIDGSEVEVFNKAFGVFDVTGTGWAVDSEKEIGLSVGWRNSMNKTLPASIAVGSRVFVCDNLCLSGELIIKRRHTLNIMADLPNMIAGALDKIEGYADRQFAFYERLRDIKITDDEAVAVVAQACKSSGRSFLARKNVLNIMDAYDHGTATDVERAAGIEYNRDQHGHGTAWALFNAGTAFAKNATNKNFVDATPALLEWDTTLRNRFGSDLIESATAVSTVVPAGLPDAGDDAGDWEVVA